jgi:hypothetical protein
VLFSSQSEKSSLLWAPTCSNGAQLVEFTRHVNLPGAPTTVAFNLYPQVFAGASSAPVFKSVELLVNGHTALEVPGASLTRPNLLELQLPSAASQWFRYGENRLDVRVTKSVSKTSAPGCNRSPSTLLGVAFGLSGTSSADLSVSGGKAPVQYVRGSVYQFNGTFTVHNLGPAAAVGGDFTFLAQIGFLQGVIGSRSEMKRAALAEGGSGAWGAQTRSRCKSDDSKRRPGLCTLRRPNTSSYSTIRSSHSAPRSSSGQSAIFRRRKRAHRRVRRYRFMDRLTAT